MPLLLVAVVVGSSTITTISSASGKEVLASSTWRPLRPRRGLVVVVELEEAEGDVVVVALFLTCFAICLRSLAACAIAMLMSAMSVSSLEEEEEEEDEAVWLLVTLGVVALVLAAAATAAVVGLIEIFLPLPRLIDREAVTSAPGAARPAWLLLRATIV